MPPTYGRFEGAADHNGRLGVTMDDINLDDVLNESNQPVAQPEAEAPQEAEQVEAKPTAQRDEKGRFAPKGDNEDAPPASDDKAKGLEAGIAAERKKRQEWEERYHNDVETLRKELEALKQPKQPEQPATPPPSVWEDDAAAFDYHKQDAVSIAVQQATMNAKLDMSEMMARQAHEDFEEMKAEFVRMMQENPALQQQALSDPHPWQRAYQIAKNARTMSELGATDLETLKAQLREQIMAEQAQAAPQTAAPNLPHSLADAQSARGDNKPAPPPLTLESILGT